MQIGFSLQEVGFHRSGGHRGGRVPVDSIHHNSCWEKGKGEWSGDSMDEAKARPIMIDDGSDNILSIKQARTRTELAWQFVEGHA